MLVQENPPSLRDKFAHLLAPLFAASFVLMFDDKFHSSFSAMLVKKSL